MPTLNLSDRTQALLWRFFLGVLIVDLPVVANQLAAPTFDWRFLAAGLLGGAVSVAEKMLAPQLADTYQTPRGSTPH